MKSTGSFLCVLLIMPLTGMAGDLTFFGGFQNPGKLTLTGVRVISQSGPEIRETTTLTHAVSVGVFGVRFKHGGLLGWEHTMAFDPNFIDGESRAFIYNSNLLVQARRPVVKPYVTVGAGAIFVSGNGLSDIGSRFALNYGGGAKFPLAGRLGGRIDVRGYSLPKIQNQWLNAVEVSFGIVVSN